MNEGPRIQKLLEWASKHSPRSKELHRFVEELRVAAYADITRLQQGIEMLTRDRSMLATIAFKLKDQLFAGRSDVPFTEGIMTDDEYRLYASARINTEIGTLMGKQQPFGPDEVSAIAERAFDEVASLGAPEALVADMRENMRRSLAMKPMGDPTIDADIAVESTGG